MIANTFSTRHNNGLKYVAISLQKLQATRLCHFQLQTAWKKFPLNGNSLFLIVNPNLNEVEVYCIGANSQITILLLVPILLLLLLLLLVEIFFHLFYATIPPASFTTQCSHIHSASHTEVISVGSRIARLAFIMPTFSNLAYCKVVGSKKKNQLLAFQPKEPTRDFYCQPIQNMPNLRKLA